MNFSVKLLGFISLCGWLLAASCTRSKQLGTEPVSSPILPPDTLVADTLPADSFPPVVLEPVEPERDSLYVERFGDFLFTYVHDSLFRIRRTRFPLTATSAAGDTLQLTARQWRASGIDFLGQDFHTLLFNNVEEMERIKGLEQEADTVVVERIDLDSLSLTSFRFARRGGRWKMFEQRSAYVQSHGLSEFLVFYRQFSTDSLFQQRCVAQPLHISLVDAEEEGSQQIEGTIDASQWFAFCPEVPRGIISNILVGQTFAAPQRVVMMKCSLGGEFNELFTFAKQDGGWMLVKYDN